MLLYIFKSGTDSKLHAFAADIMGSRLPEQFQPWHAIGMVGADKEPPHRLSRTDIEQAINDHGYQLWRRRPKPAQA